MKKYLLFITLLANLGMASSALAQQVNRPAKFGPKPYQSLSSVQMMMSFQVGTRSGNFAYNTTNSMFILTDSSLYTYDAAGRLLTETKRLPSGLNLTRDEFVYNSQGILIETRNLVWNPLANMFQLISKQVEVFDVQGNQTLFASLNYSMGVFVDTGFVERTQYVYNTSNRITQITRTSSSNPTTRELYTYNLSNHVISVTFQNFDSTLNSFQNDSRQVFLVAADGRITQFTEEFWSGSLWEPDSRFINVVWQTWNGSYFNLGDVQSYTEEFFNGTVFEPQARYRAIYGLNGSYVSYDSTWNGSSYVPDTRSTLIIDNQLNRRMFSRESWTGSNWMIDTKDSIEYLYNAQNGITRKTEYFWTSTTNSLVPIFRRVFSNFITIAGAEGQVSAELERIKTYPNPVSDQLNIEVPFSGLVWVRVFDGNGREVFQSKWSEAMKSLDISTMATGIYLMQIQTERGVASRRLIKQ